MSCAIIRYYNYHNCDDAVRELVGDGRKQRRDESGSSERLEATTQETHYNKHGTIR